MLLKLMRVKFGKMKYGRGKPVNGLWVFSGIERALNKFFFIKWLNY